jgi:hypothetical protein
VLAGTLRGHIAVAALCDQPQKAFFILDTDPRSEISFFYGRRPRCQVQRDMIPDREVVIDRAVLSRILASFGLAGTFKKFEKQFHER